MPTVWCRLMCKAELANNVHGSLYKHVSPVLCETGVKQHSSDWLCNFLLSYADILIEREVLMQKYIHLVQIVETEKIAANQLRHQLEDQDTEIERLKSEVFPSRRFCRTVSCLLSLPHDYLSNIQEKNVIPCWVPLLSTDVWLGCWSSLESVVCFGVR